MAGRTRNKSLVTVKSLGKDRAAKQALQIEVLDSNLISTQGGELSLNDVPLPEPFHCVILNVCNENAYYKDKWTPDSKEVPICFSISKAGSELEESEKLSYGMAPHPNSELPQARNCEECHNNQYDSAEEGRGKACGNRKRVLLVPADKIERGADVAILKIPPTALLMFSKYLTFLTSVQEVPTEFVISAVTMRKANDKAIQKTPYFEFVNYIEQNQIEIVDDLIAKNLDLIKKPFEKFVDVEESAVRPARKKKVSVKKKPVRKKATTSKKVPTRKKATTRKS